MRNTGVYPKITGETGKKVQVYIGTSNEYNESPTWGAASTYTIGSAYKVDVRATARVISIRFEGSAAAATTPWKLSSYAIEYDIVGNR